MRALLAILILATVARAADDDFQQDIRNYLDRDSMERQTGYNYDPFNVWSQWYGDVRAGVWFPRLEGPIAVKGTKVLDLTNALNVRDRNGTPFVRVTIGYDVFGLIFDFRQLQFAGSVRAQARFELGGKVFEFDETLVTDLTINQFRILPTWCVYRRPGIQVNLLAAIGLNLLEGSFSTTTGESDGFSQLLPTAFIGANVKGHVGKLAWEVEVKGLSINLDEFGGGLLDVDGSVGYRFWGSLSVRVGYRYSKLDGYYKIFSAKFIADGFYISLQWDF